MSGSRLGLEDIYGRPGHGGLLMDYDESQMGNSRPPPVSDVRRDYIRATVECDVLPTLIAGHRMGAGAGRKRRSAQAKSVTPNPADLSEFCRLLLSDDGVESASAYVDKLRARGCSLETVLLKMFGPSARFLGDLWCTDDCDFVDVTVGLARLQQLLREVSAEFVNEPATKVIGKRALLMPVPGEQHTFGLAMVEEFFRRTGWVVNSAATADAAGILNRVRARHFDVVGLSIAGEVLLPVLQPLIQSIRKASRNRHITVLVGGALMVDRPRLFAEVGADATALDGRQAVRQVPHVLQVSAVA